MEALSQEVRDGNRGVWGRGGEEARTEAKLKDLESIRSSLEKAGRTPETVSLGI